jgi:putative peptidoglycan lipid II flippase
VRLLFERGTFTPEDTRRAAHVLVFYGFALWAFCAQHIVLRAFYSTHDVRTPLIISTVLLPLNVILNVAFVWVPAIREAAFALSACFTSGLSVIIGALILQRRTNCRILAADFGLALLRMALVAAATGVLVHLTMPAWQAWSAAIESRALLGGVLPWPRLAARLVGALGPLAQGGIIFLLAAWLLRLHEVALLMPRRFRRKPEPASTP